MPRLSPKPHFIKILKFHCRNFWESAIWGSDFLVSAIVFRIQNKRGFGLAKVYSLVAYPKKGYENDNYGILERSRGKNLIIYSQDTPLSTSDMVRKEAVYSSSSLLSKINV